MKMLTLGQRLEQLRTSNNETKEFAAAKAGVAGATYGQWEKDLVIPRDDKLHRLAKHYQVSFEWLRVGIDPTQVTPLAEGLLVSVNAYQGNGELLFDSRQLPDCYSGRLVYIQVEGHSMTDTFPDGSYLIIDLEDTHFKDDKLYVFRTNDFISVRKLSFTSSGVRLESIGSSKEELLTFQQLSKVDVLGRVIYSFSPR
ncbi:hypothetical protein AKJ18_22050 [Vibrio xuii]|nr:hypothetical protein AKJ18_22050 [Vibrio xuii]